MYVSDGELRDIRETEVWPNIKVLVTRFSVVEDNVRVYCCSKMQGVRKPSGSSSIRHKDWRKLVRSNLVEASSLEERVELVARAKSKDVGDLDDSARLR